MADVVDANAATLPTVSAATLPTSRLRPKPTPRDDDDDDAAADDDDADDDDDEAAGSAVRAMQNSRSPLTAASTSIPSSGMVARGRSGALRVPEAADR
jgi:hypothetical protein